MQPSLNCPHAQPELGLNDTLTNALCAPGIAPNTGEVKDGPVGNASHTDTLPPTKPYSAGRLRRWLVDQRLVPP